MPSDLSVRSLGKGGSIWGHAIPFRLLDRLSRRPDQYLTHLDLLHDVWHGQELMTDTVCRTVRRLRHQLREGVMGDLAPAVRGHNGLYSL